MKTSEEATTTARPSSWKPQKLWLLEDAYIPKLNLTNLKQAWLIVRSQARTEMMRVGSKLQCPQISPGLYSVSVAWSETPPLQIQVFFFSST